MMRAHHRGFTATELLVVLALLAVIFLLLVPAINTQREKRNRVSCAGNLQRIGIALLAYAQDHEMHLPMAEKNNVKGKSATWDAALLNGYLAFASDLHCPRDTITRTCDQPPRSYAISGGANGEWNRNWIHGAYLKRPELSRCSEIVAVAEGWDGARPLCVGEGWGFVRGWQVASFHHNPIVGDTNTYSKTSNYLFLDGHAEWVETPTAEQFSTMFPPVPPGYP